VEFYEVWTEESGGWRLTLSHSSPDVAVAAAEEQYPGDPLVTRQVWFVDVNGVRSVYWPVP
jgi:hypothetical protein